MKPPKKFWLYLTAAAVPLSSLMVFWHRLIGVGAVALSVALFLFAFAFYNRRRHLIDEARFLSAQILNRYGVDDIEKTQQITHNYCLELAAYEQELSELDEKREDRAARLDTAQEELEQILQQTRQFAPSCTTAEEAKDAIRVALSVHSMYMSEERALELQRVQLASMQKLLGGVTQYTPDEEALALDEAKITYEKYNAQQQLRALTLRLGEYRGRLSAMDDDAMLQAQLEAAENELAEATRLERVLDIAIEAVKNADETLRSRFSPQITAEAAKLLSELTDGKYANLLLRHDMQLSVRESSDPVMHPAAAMSCGTSDQMYLALRLAMVRRLLPSDAPILLDDALVNFDDARSIAALRLLAKENRQIIFFSCKEIPNVL